MTTKELIRTAKLLSGLSWYQKALIPKIIKAKDIYQRVEDVTGVPKGFIAAVHVRENGPDVGKFQTYLGNGQSLNRVTTIVPKGRGPFKSWSEGAIDAIKLQKLDKIEKWDLETAVTEWEKYNGLGYRKRGKNSPYVWTGTQHGVGVGYFTSDGVYSATAKDRGIGVFALYTLLINEDADFKIKENLDYEIDVPVDDKKSKVKNFIAWFLSLFNKKV